MTEHFAFALHVYYPYCPCRWPPSRPWVLHGRTIVDSCRCHLAQPAEELRPICNSKSVSSSSFHFTQGTAELCSGVSRIINWSISVKADMIYWCLHLSPNLFFPKSPTQVSRLEMCPLGNRVLLCGLWSASWGRNSTWIKFTDMNSTLFYEGKDEQVFVGIFCLSTRYTLAPAKSGFLNNLKSRWGDKVIYTVH